MGPYAMFSEAGKLEHKLPAFFLIVPNRYLKAHPLLRDALRYDGFSLSTRACRNVTLKPCRCDFVSVCSANEQQIVTAYDVYATIIDIAAKGDPDVRIVTTLDLSPLRLIMHESVRLVSPCILALCVGAFSCLLVVDQGECMIFHLHLFLVLRYHPNAA